ncbi:MAG TPA: nitronate monooxygenase [Solirubrobacter sp.]|nr:nitronate monooxygenase [Solirubrobacter sp.]
MHAPLQLIREDARPAGADAAPAVAETPPVAAGGIATPEAVRATLALGARAVQAGTAFLLAPEAGTSAPHRAALATDRPTAPS